jgi:membrane-bound serine protease (ClpP class)
MVKAFRFIFYCLFLLNSQLFSEEAVSTLDLNLQLREQIKFKTDATNHVGHILIDDRTNGISDSTWLYVKKALDQYRESKPIFIILELNTPGGEVYAAQKISDALKEMDIQSDIPIVTFINNWAISAGAMLAYSTRFITITKDASMGAAEPVLSTQTGEMKEASEKINSAMRADFANRARYFDRNPYIAEGMVDKDIILVKRDGQIIKVDAENQIKTTDTLIKAKGKLLTLNAQQLMEDKVANILLSPTKLPFITEQERDAGKWPGEKMLLFQAPFFKEIPNVEIDSYRMDWKTKFFVFLANPFVASLLVLGLMLGFYMEMSHPGLGFPAGLALICLFLIILSNLSLQIANWLEVIFLLTGLLIIMVDLFLLPTFGLLGFVGVLLFLGGLFAMMLPGLNSVNFDYDTSTFNAAGIVFIERLALLCATLLFGILLMILIGRYITPKLGAWSKLVLTGHEQEGYVAGWNPEKLPKVGTAGEVTSTLRPAGKVTIGDDIYDAITDGIFLEKGTAIVIKRIEGSVLVVEEVRK